MWAEIKDHVEQRLQTQQNVLLRALTAQVCQYHQGVVHEMTELAQDIAKQWHTRSVAQQTRHACSCEANGDLNTHLQSPTFNQHLHLGTLMGAIQPAVNEASIEQSEVSWDNEVKYQGTSNNRQCAPLPRIEQPEVSWDNEVKYQGTNNNRQCAPLPRIEQPEVSWDNKVKYQGTNNNRQCAPLPIERREGRMSPNSNRSSIRNSPSAGQHPSLTSSSSLSSCADSAVAQFLENRHPNPHSNLRKFVEGFAFDVITSMTVIVCTVMMALECEYAGMQAGYVIKSPGCDTPASHNWPHAKDVFAASEIAFNVIFSIELTFRIIAMKQDACRSKFIFLDTVLVITGWVSYFNEHFMVNPLILRLGRLMRLGRVLKLLRNASVIQTLFLLVRSIRASFGCLLWSFSILWFFQIVMAILMSQLLQQSIMDESKDIEVRLKLFSYFGTFTRGLITMFEVTLANWVPSCRLLYDNVSDWFGAVYIGYRCCFMFAIIKVITAVFIAETTRCANSDVELAVQKKCRERDGYLAKCTELFHHLDKDQSGTISWDELEALVTDTLLKKMLVVLDVDAHDLIATFAMHDRGDGCFDLQSFISNIEHVKAAAKSIQILKLNASIDVIRQKVDAILSK